ncbi:autotransporter outer membrane beta-barrel domain-containing protein [uncultured Albimonas sp.]|uniref:autotransporter outer membrane beta-barrel domain-containing protein n=1 Tax=uncultured Albimonas sp. TaxID=1331701 RepID=UPI0030EBCBD5
MLLGSCAAPALALAGAPAMAQQYAEYACTPISSGGVSCTIPDTASISGFQELYTGPDGDNDPSPDAPDAAGYALTNNATINQSAGQFAVLGVRSRGGQGSTEPDDAGQSGAGGAVTITNAAGGVVSVGDLSFNAAAGDGLSVGLWDDGGVIYGLYAASIGGNGIDARPQTIGGGDGGKGGGGGVATAVNHGFVEVAPFGSVADGASRVGAVAMMATSASGSGGDRDGTDGEDPQGGGAGDAKDVYATNTGILQVCSPAGCEGRPSGAALSTLAAGIYAESISGHGADPTSSGGNGGLVSVTNSGEIDVVVPVDPGGAAWGIYAASHAGYAAIDSRSITVPGGPGGSSKFVAVDHSGAITLDAGDFDAPVADQIERVCADGSTCLVDETPALANQSAGILAVSLGAWGGAGKLGVAGEDGGDGGDASTNAGSSALQTTTVRLRAGSSVEVTGDNVLGVGVLLQGGGGGRSEANDTSGGDGGDTAAIDITLGAGGAISTEGDGGIGLIARTKGGAGGPASNPSGIVDFSNDAAGQGGDAGDVSLSGSASGAEQFTITTRGDRAIGVALQSLSGSGGGGSEGYSIISTGELDGGRGGAAGRVSFTNSITLDTDGRGAHGMVLQSIAGGGGDLSDQGGLIAVAGSGGAGEPGGAVEFAGYDSHISTAGDASAGLVAQSIGGGGGDVVGSLAGDGNQGASFGVYSVGGQGGDGGMGGAVLAQLNAGASIYTGGRYAYGALLQSVGGGGGNGGDVFALASRLPVVAVGGDGSVAGNGGAVTFRSGNDGGGTQTLSTAGDNAHGLLAQSIGGGGGAGGDARADAFGLGALSAVAMAGGGDSGGAGGTVTVDATNLAIVTTGMQAKGLVAHSIGGGGGAAGSASAVDVSFGLATSVGIGGQGGDGGAGGTVNFSLARTTIATGVADDPDASVNAHGLVAQSIGGGGGVGGSGAALSYAADLPIPEADANIAIAGAAGVGGQGGGGGAGGEVDLTLGDAVVTTHGYGAHGILVHSVGGGGGDGGDGSSMAAASLLLDKIKEAIGGVLPDDGEGGEGGEEEAGGVSINASVSVSVGGTGGNGGNGGAVDLSLNAGTRVETFGPSANAVAGQSIGGGGGNGGIASPSTKKFGEGAGVVTSIAVGGRGATLGAFGGALRAELAADAMLLTHGEGSRGLFLQTIGGGGGTSQTTSVSFTSKLTDAIVAKLGGLKAPRLKVGVGMTGGEGGSGGVVRQVDVEGAIATFGADADAVLVQTIGGGGGLGGSFGGNGVEEESGERTPLEFGLELQEIKEQIARPWALNVNVGGTGGTGGPGGNFAVASTETDDLKMPTVAGSIHTRGDFSDGVVLQSIGGGGGAGGAAVPHDSIGVLDLSMRIGGTGGTGGVGGAVGIRLEETASLATDGFGAHGVVLQSIGGGGGMGGSGSRLIANLGIDAEPEQPAPENADGVTGAVPTNENAGFDLLDPGELYGDANNALPAAVVRLGIGSSGAGGAGANAARAEANGVAGNRIRTQGFNAFGLSVQSIGGGGGMGGIGTAPLTAAEVGLETLDPDDRQVFADDFNALFRGAHLDFIAGGDGGRGGDGGPAVAQGVFDVATLGPRSLGLLVQSVGGGGGAAGIEGARLLRQGSEGTNGSGGPARLTLDAGSAVSTAGIGSHGAIVQSVAGGGGATMASLAYGSAVRRFDADLPPTEALGLAFDLALGSGGVAGTGRAGTVTLDLNAAIFTTGDYAYGAIAQSIGAGGGVASLTPAEIDRTTTTAVSSGSVTLGTATGCADLSDCSGAGLIAATVRGGAQITTTGAGSRGVVVQTVQSGGGVASGFETLQRPSAGEGDAVSLSLRVEGGFPFLHTDDVSTLTHSGAVTTLGADADGVVFQMIGGGGGVLGSAGGGGATLEGQDIVTTRAPVEVVADAASYEMTVSLGHAGAAGGAQNNDLLATLGGEITTYGDFAEAAIVQSISGGGGVAGLSHDATSAAQANLSIRVGGDGVTDGVNALAQDVVDNTSVNRDLEDDIPGGELTAAISGATYATAGYAANGVVIQQIQGGGGVAASGSRSLRAVKETLGNGDERLGLTVGGNYGGTDGGAAMTVSVGEGSTVATSGAASHAVLAQNIVGGGGLGAVGSFVRDSSGALGDNLIDVAVGGSNTTGVSNIEIFDAGKPDEDVTTPEVGDLTLTFANASVVTSGNLSTGVLAQSIAGGGGVAAAPSAGLRSLSLGATGGQAGNGGLVEFTLGGDAQNPTSVATYGFASRAFVMQSISGGGGLFAGASAGEDYTVSAAPIRLGATGYSQGKGRPVSGTFAAAAATSGDFADGVAIQSIGGGGGIADIAAAGRAPAGVDLALGQTLGQGNAGGVQATPAATGQATGIDTAGVGAYGLVVQSIGGGGGIASHQAAAASTTLTLGAASSTGPQNADLAAIRFNLVSLRPLVADSIDHVITRGDDAHAIVAQSIGGGGGIARTLGAGDAGEAVLTLGGNAQGQEARGGAAVVETFARVLTGGDRAVGIVAQSIGGGGGIASAGDIAGVRSASLGANAEGDGSLDANDVLVEIVTDGACAADSLDKCSGTVGEGAHGIVAQSIGGGGGMAGDISLADGIRLETYDPASFADVFGGRNGRGASGEVDVEIGTILTTQGAGAYGVIAQSIAGGGGLAGFGQAAYAGRSGGGDPDRNKAGKVSVDVYKGGGVIASGENSAGIFVQSLGDDIATQSLDIYIEGTVAGGTGEFGVGLLAHGGNASNRLELTRTGVLTAASGTAIRYQGATSDADSRFTLVNDGVIDGSVEATYANGEAYFSAEGSTLSRVAAPTAAAASAGRLSAPAARLINRRGGLATGARVYEADVTNRGTMQVGETDGFSRLAIAGHLEQGARGVILADIKPLAGKGDVLAVAGDARLDGKLLVAFDALTGGAEHRVLEVEGEVTGRFERVASNLFTFAQSVDAEGLVLRADRARIAGRDGLGEAEIAAARYLERLFVAGDESFGRFFGKLDAAAGAGALGPVLTGMTLGASLAGEAATFELARDRFDALLGCDAPGSRTVGDGQSCLRMLASSRSLEQDADGGAAGYQGEVQTTGLAAERRISPQWSLSGAVGYERTNLGSGVGRGSVDGGAGFLGLAATRELGGFAFSAGAMLGYAEFDTDRVAGPFSPGAAKAEHSALSLGGRLRAAWTQDFGGGYLRPTLDLDLIHVSAEGYTETGARRQSLRVAGSEATALVVTPSLEAGATQALDEGLGLRAWARVGASLSSLDAYDATARFATDLTGVTSFSNGVATAQAVGRIGAGVSLLNGDTLDVGLRYEGAFADGYSGHTGSINIAVRF